MRSPASSPAPGDGAPSADATRPAWQRWALPLVLLATIAAYLPSLRVPFYLDDGPSIVDNATIRQLWPPGAALHPPGNSGETVSGRPVLNLSLAVSHALSGDAPWGYHALNLAIHLLGGLVLFGLLRRTLALPGRPERMRSTAAPLALVASALWLLHPLQTEAVTYVIQRAESLAALFYLATLYSYLRAATADGTAARRAWFAAAVIASWLGMGTKETMVTVPVAAWLLDRAFLAGGFREALRRRGSLLAGVASGWLLLASLVGATAGRGGSAGFGRGVSPWDYLLTQCEAIVHYLRLVVWPQPLILDYGSATVSGLVAVLPQALLMIALLALAGWALVRHPRAGFGAAAFFLVLAPSSSVVPIVSQTIAEHRMYLPLAAVVTLALAGAVLRWGASALWAGLVVAVACGGLTWQRNRELQRPEDVWTEVIASRPENARARLCLGTLLNKRGDVSGAIGEYEAALRLQPDYIEALNNLGNALQQQGRLAEAIARYQAVLRLKPDWADTHFNLALAYQRTGRLADAIAEYRAALRLAPDDPDTHFYLGNVLGATGDLTGAIAEYERALALRPNFPGAVANLETVRRVQRQRGGF